MTGPEHYKAAEEALTSLRVARASVNTTVNLERAAVVLAEAQVHATLALAAATALSEPSRTAPRATVPEWDAWHEATGVQNEGATPSVW
ncbi:hypothetical protein ACWGUL_01405 [Streptomyces albidoflavus]